MSVLRLLNLVFLGLFLLSVGVQYNDPDPVRWMLIYGAAALACIFAHSRPIPRAAPAIIAVVALAWMIALLPKVTGQVGFKEMFREAGMATMEIEEGREAIGLALVVIWMTVLTFVGRRIARSPAPAQANL
jgi:hypothetical protein